jgi:hypothetical protein
LGLRRIPWLRYDLASSRIKIGRRAPLGGGFVTIPQVLGELLVCRTDFRPLSLWRFTSGGCQHGTDDEEAAEF